MTSKTGKILQDVLELPPVERAERVEQMLASFEFPNREEIDAARAKEAEERLHAYERGEIKSVPASTVFEKIDRRYSDIYSNGIDRFASL